ncbi:MAG: S8 family serine peptidase [Chitinophagaceae bacterium]|nr:S8 family serine peptidase [Chitinophagaceae bacterium]
MNIKKIFFAIIVLHLIMNVGIAQKNRYVIYFTDKNNTPYSLERPNEFLSLRSIERRTRQSISLTPSDIPVNTTYIQDIERLGADVYFSSRWLNCLLIESSPSLLPSIMNISFVSKVELVANGSQLNNQIAGSEKTFSLVSARNNEINDFDYQIQTLGGDFMHSNGFKGEGKMVAVFDGGFRGVDTVRYFRHLFQKKQLIHTFNYVYNNHSIYQSSSHGTAVLSCLAAVDNTKALGMIPNALYILALTEDVSNGDLDDRIEEYNWLFAAEKADSIGVDVINSSLGYFVFSIENQNYTSDQLDGNTAIISKAAQFAFEKGIAVVSSAGNEGNSAWKKITPPADSRGALTVGAIGKNLQIATTSSRGKTSDKRIKPDVVAFGVNVSIITSSGNVSTISGTSFSAPLVAGLLTGYWQYAPHKTVYQIYDDMRKTSSNSSNPDSLYGYGIPSFYNLLEKKPPIPILSITSLIKSDITVYPNPIRNKILYIKNDGEKWIETIVLQIYNMEGNVLLESKYNKLYPQSFITIDIASLKPQLYFLKLRGNDFEKQIKIVVE